ncbi:hypothetical protein PINS_up001249 [Pythium insidiosum]|nr:hypothetical protein PINS_up001249 [Pythium insidiosum]
MPKMKRVALSLALLLAVASAGGDATQMHCVRWRATAKCDPHGGRVPQQDAPCSQVIPSGQSGYCECENRRRVREVGCEHHEFRCEDACRDDASAELSYPQGFEYVTCGSSIKLVHEPTAAGSSRSPAHGARNDPNSYWLVKEADSAPACALGTRVACGATIRLEHTPTRRNLHTHAFRAPLSSQQQEVSAFGVAGEGDAGDNWVVECEERQQCSAIDQCEDDGLWKRGELVRLRSVATGRYLLTSHRARFDDSNCPRCLINGQQEVSATAQKDEQTLWFASEGIYVSPQ